MKEARQFSGVKIFARVSASGSNPPHLDLRLPRYRDHGSVCVILPRFLAKMVVQKFARDVGQGLAARLC
jgi:hypothetical protein